MKGLTINLTKEWLMLRSAEQVEYYISKMIFATRNSSLKIKLPKARHRMETEDICKLLGIVLFKTYMNDIKFTFNRQILYAQIKFSKNTIEIKSIHPYDKK